jgi:hypothetical protein
MLLLNCEHRLPIKLSFRPHKQSDRHFNLIMYGQIKEDFN